jgi:hypothetical protein
MTLEEKTQMAELKTLSYILADALYEAVNDMHAEDTMRSEEITQEVIEYVERATRERKIIEELLPSFMEELGVRAKRDIAEFCIGDRVQYVLLGCDLYGTVVDVPFTRTIGGADYIYVPVNWDNHDENVNVNVNNIRHAGK